MLQHIQTKLNKKIDLYCFATASIEIKFSHEDVGLVRERDTRLNLAKKNGFRKMSHDRCLNLTNWAHDTLPMRGGD